MSTLVQPAPQKLEAPTLPKGDDCLVVIFGGTGDLTHRKLIPALYDLACVGCTTRNFQILGIGRTKLDDDAYRGRLHDGTATSKDTRNFSEDGWKDFSERLHYLVGDASKPEFYPQLKKKIAEMQKAGASKNIMFYVSTSASLAPPIVEGLGQVGLAKNAEGWTRVILEKPFGSDLKTAQELNDIVANVFEESAVYRIDHYLGKETVQNIMMFRFGNSMFEPVWNRRHVASVQVTVAEEVGMAGGRGAYYDTAGTLRDMVQNHMMQLLSLVAMEPPVDLSADAVRNEKVKVLQALPKWQPADVFRNVVRAQYGKGSIQGAEVPGYLEEKGVAPHSKTDTYVAIRLELNTWRWAGVPFFLRTGKRLPKRATEIAIQFRRPPTELFEADPSGPGSANQLVLRIQPNEGASLTFEAKVPGSRRRLQEVRMDFRYGTAFAVPPPEAYERLLLDAMLGDPTLYTRTDEVESAWRFASAILSAWNEPDAPPPDSYVAGSWGPEAADALVAADGARWRWL